MERPVNYVRHATSCHCGHDSAWYEVTPDGAEIGRGCATCRSPLDTDTPIPTQVWAVVGQRGLVMLCESLFEAKTELLDMDDKYRPAYVLQLSINAATVIGARETSEDPVLLDEQG